MHIVWVVPNAHPNHRGWIAGLSKRGHRCRIEAVRLTGTKVGAWTESVDVDIHLIAESPLSRFIRHRFPGRRDKGRRLFFPPIRHYLQLLDQLDADLFIVRPQSIPLLSIVSLHCRRRRIPLIVYEQHDPRSPRKWTSSRLRGKERLHAVYGSLRLQLLGYLFGNGVMSPVLHSDIDHAEEIESFIPFPATPLIGPRLEVGPPIGHVWPRDSCLKILSVARFMPRKHHLALIEAIEALRGGGIDLACAMVGQAAGAKEESFLKALRDRVDASPHREAMTILANLSADGSLAHLYSGADIFVLPAAHEPASVAVVEAIGHGLPVVVSTSCGTAGYVKPGLTGLHVQAGSVDALEQALGRLLRDSQELARMSSATAARRDTTLSPEAIAQRIETLMRRASQRFG